MAPLGLYNALAASASVFVGILTALLVNNISNRKSERARIKRRIDAINSRLEGSASRQNRLEKQMNQIEEKWEEREERRARSQVEDFVENGVGSDYVVAIENLTIPTIEILFVEYINHDLETITEYHRSALEEQLDEIEAKMATAVVNHFISDYEDMAQEERKELKWEEIKESFKREYDIENLDEQTVNKLEKEYRRIKPVERTGPLSEIFESIDSLNTLNHMNNDISLPTSPSDGITAAKMQNKTRERIHEEDLYNRSSHQKIQIKQRCSL